MKLPWALGLILIGCAPATGKNTFFTPGCRGIYYERDDYGNLKKYNEVEQDGRCLTDNVALSVWEQSLELRQKKGVKCVPQQQFSPRSLVSANNFYSYRNSRMYLDLDSSTGEFRRLILAEGKKGEPVFSRLQGCFYERSGQILLDTTDAASSQYFDPLEIFTYTETASTLEMIRFDDSIGWDYRFCPYLDTPWAFCNLLKTGGNEMFFPTLTVAEQSSLLDEAILIRRQFNWSAVSNFSTVWEEAETSRTEVAREDYKYAVQTIVDTPLYIDQAWADFIRGERPVMPDVSSNRVPPICYPGKRDVTLDDGSTSSVYGEICYIDGQYVFTQ